MATTQEQITRITEARNTLRNKGVDLGIATSTDKLDALATKFDAIENRGTVNAQVQEGEAYTIQPGYYKGGSVSGVSGGGNYTLQSKTVTPTKKSQNVTADSGYYGLSDVQVNAIPDNFNDTSAVTAGAADVLANKIIVNAAGETVPGTMPDNGAVTKTLDVATTSYTVPKGYHNGSGKVSITTETKSATPSESTQTVSASTGKVLSSVTVNPIPAKYGDASGATAKAAQILDGYTAVVSDGTGAELVEGAMVNNGAVSQVLSVGTTSYTVPAGYHDGTGKVSISTETKSVTPTKSAQTITPTAGKVLSSVSVAAIPAQYITTDDATALAGEILDGKTAYVDGVKVEGTMTNNGAVNLTIDGLTQLSATIPAGYTSGGAVTLTDDIYNQLAAI